MRKDVIYHVYLVSTMDLDDEWIRPGEKKRLDAALLHVHKAEEPRIFISSIKLTAPTPTVFYPFPLISLLFPGLDKVPAVLVPPPR